MYKFLRYTLVFALAPTLALAQDKKQGPCPDVTINLSELSALSELKIDKLMSNLENLESLGELKALAALESLEALKQLEDLHELSFEYQTGDVLEAAYDAEKRKVIEKSFKVNNNSALSITNEWGRVHVNTWDKNEIKVKVDVITRASTDAKAQEMLNNIKILESHEGNTFSFRTKLEPMRINGSSNKSMEINYTVYMPAKSKLTVQNSFGDVYLASMVGQVDLNLKHGSLKCMNLNNPNNRLKITYGKGVCESLKGGSIETTYTDFRVEDASDLRVASRYGDFRLGKLGDGMEMDFKHGSFRVDSISKNLRSLALDSNYSSVYLNFDEGAAFNFAVNVQFGNFNVDKSLVTITSLEKDYTSAEYKGKFGGSSPKGLVSINSKYGDVKFTK